LESVEGLAPLPARTTGEGSRLKRVRPGVRRNQFKPVPMEKRKPMVDKGIGVTSIEPLPVEADREWMGKTLTEGLRDLLY